VTAKRPNVRAASLISRAAKRERSHELDAFARMYASGAVDQATAAKLCAQYEHTAKMVKAREYLARAAIELYFF